MPYSLEKASIGIVTKNSTDFVSHVFSAYRDDKFVVFLKSDQDRERLEVTKTTEIYQPTEGYGWMEAETGLRSDHELAQISFTSGTEGLPKGVLLTHSMLNNVTERLNSIMEVTSDIREYIGVPVNFSFGMGRCRAIFAAGGKAFLPQNGFNPIEIRNMLLSGEINAISAVPTLWRTLLANRSIFGKETHQVRWIEIGSQYMSQQEKEEMKTLFPQAIICQHYGLTEASRSTFLRIDKETGQTLESVGQVVGDTLVRINPEGAIEIKGGHVATHLLINGELKSNTNQEGWLTTKDKGFIDSGYLTYEGRIDDLINVGGIKISPELLESDIKKSTDIHTGYCISGIPDPVLGERILLTVDHNATASLETLLQATHSLLERSGMKNRNVVSTNLLDQIPVTPTGKIQRRSISQEYSKSTQNQDKTRTDSNTAASTDEMNDAEAEVAAIWEQVLKTPITSIDQSFFDLGGDSLTAMTAIISMERAGAPQKVISGLLQGHTIREIAEDMEASSTSAAKHVFRGDNHKSAMINAVRGLMVLSVIIAHWSGAFLERLPSALMAHKHIIDTIIAPFLTLGTPGFAVIYGVGAGYSLYPTYLKSPERLHAILKPTIKILGFGIALMALTKFLAFYLASPSVTFTNFTNSFYSVLTFYFLVVLSLPIIFKLVTYSPYPTLFCLLLAAVSYTLHTYALEPLGKYRPSGLIEFAKLLLTAKYAYFNMLTGVFLGMAVGLSIHKKILLDSRSSEAALIGMTIGIFGLLVCLADNRLIDLLTFPSSRVDLWRWVLYFGVVIMALAAVHAILSHYNNLNAIYRITLQSLSIIGLLAFPLFVGHELVMPIKNMLAMVINEGIALLISMSLFFIAFILIGRKVYRLNFQH